MRKWTGNFARSNAGFFYVANPQRYEVVLVVTKWFWWLLHLGLPHQVTPYDILPYVVGLCSYYKYFPYIRTAFIKFGFAVNSPALVVWGFFIPNNVVCLHRQSTGTA